MPHRSIVDRDGRGAKRSGREIAADDLGVAIEEVLLIGGAAGVGKSAVGWEMSVQLKRAGFAHWFLDADVLDAAWPRRDDDLDGSRLTVRNLRAMGEVFSSEGYTRCIYSQAAAVVDQNLIIEALGPVRMKGFLLTASEPVRTARLTQREIGTDLDRHISAGARMVQFLHTTAPAWVERVDTDERGVDAVARIILSKAGWTLTS